MSSTTTPNPQPPKLGRLLQGSTLHKRPLPQRPPAPRSLQTLQLLISPSTPFSSVLRRARKHLVRTATRTRGPVARHAAVRERLALAGTGKQNKTLGEVPATVVLIGSGRAVEKVLRLAGAFEGAEGGNEYEVAVRTRSIATVDDVQVGGGEHKYQDKGEHGDLNDKDDDGDRDMLGDEMDGLDDVVKPTDKRVVAEAEDADYSRVRRLSCLEVTVRLRPV